MSFLRLSHLDKPFPGWSCTREIGESATAANPE